MILSPDTGAYAALSLRGCQPLYSVWRITSASKQKVLASGVDTSYPAPLLVFAIIFKVTRQGAPKRLSSSDLVSTGLKSKIGFKM